MKDLVMTLTREERDNIMWALSCSTGGLDADGVRAYMAPWERTANALEEERDALARRVRELEAALEHTDGILATAVGELAPITPDYPAACELVTDFVEAAQAERRRIRHALAEPVEAS